LKIGKLSQLTGCNIETIRYYEKIGLLNKPNRSEGNYRLYDDKHTKELKFILKAKFLGFSLNQIRELKKLSESKTLSSCSKVSKIATVNLKVINEKIHDLENLRSQIESLLNCCKNNVEPSCPLINSLY